MSDKSSEKSQQHIAEKLSVDKAREDAQHMPPSIIYPKANLYYAFAEDVHPTTRIAVAKSLQREEPVLPLSPQDPRSVNEAVTRYLLTDPPYFVVFGKPGLNSLALAAAIADAWNCVFISPAPLIQQKIDAGDEEGQRMKETLENGGCISLDIIMSLIENRLKEENDVKHRGYVVEGLPFIPSEASLDRDRSEFREDQTCDEAASCNQQPDNNSPDDSVCQVQPDYERQIPQQVDEMFTKWSRKPSIIIYMVCPKQDVVSLVIRQDGAKAATTDAVAAEDVLDDESDQHQDTEEQPIVSDDREKNDSERVSDVRQKVERQCDLYTRLALPAIDKWILAHDPQRVIRVDGRGSTQRIFQTLNARLRMLPLQPSILPKRVTFETDDSKISENDLPKKAFEILRQRDVVSADFPWRLSAWKFCCPKELAFGRLREGDAKYAVHFLRNIFFFSSQEAVDLFVENPRTFLSPNPRLTCKIAVIGPEYSGTSELSLQLAKIFGATVINVKEILKTQVQPNVPVLIAQNIKNISDEKFNEFDKDCGYVVDGIPIKYWSETSDIVAFEHVVFLYERDPYNRLKYRFDVTRQPKQHNRYSQYDYDNGYNYGYVYPTSSWNNYNMQFLKYHQSHDHTSKKNVITCNLAEVDNVIDYVLDRLTLFFRGAISAMNVKETATAQDTTAAETNEAEEKCLPRVVDLNTAEQLLDCGYYFISSFGRRCPVQAYANGIPLAQGPIFPVIHCAYIYFIAGEEALSAFLKEPAKYLTPGSRSPVLPLRIAVIGPPRCGKTTLADRFAKTYGLKRITRDVALRHMLKHHSWSKSARMAEEQLRAGRPAPVESMTRAIETLTLGPRAISQGYVLDDYPSSREEAEQLILSGVQPMIVLDLQADLSFCLQCQTADNSNVTDASSFPDFLACYENWQVHQAGFRDWLKRFSRNVVELDASRNKWGVWTLADDAVRSRFAEIALYQRDADLDKKVHSLRYLCVSPFEFRQRQSRFESYCPVCLFRKDILQASNQPTDNQGTVQFKEHFYWVCPEHIAAFAADPQQHLPPVNTATLPDQRPQIIEQVVDVRHVCWERRLRLQGWCPVSYVDGPADRRLTRGRADLAVLLGEEEVYLLCSKECRDKFLARHQDYDNVEFASPLEIDPRGLSDVDFLNRTLAKEVVEAVKRVAARRPKIVGLSAAASAAIHIGVHLKTHHASLDSDETLIYQAAGERMAERDKIVRIVTDTVRKRPNPYAQSSTEHVAVNGEQKKPLMESRASDCSESVVNRVEM